MDTVAVAQIRQFCWIAAALARAKGSANGKLYCCNTLPFVASSTDKLVLPAANV